MMASLAMALTSAPQWAPFFIGAYTSPQGSQGISYSRLNLETGQMEPPRLAAKIENPSCLAIHPSLKVLYAVSEFTDGDLASFSIADDGSLTPLNAASFKGGGPCHLSVTPDGRTLLAAAYGEGSLGSFPLGEDGKIRPAASVFQHSGQGPRADRQEGPHMHFAASSPDGRFVYGVCLGTDSILGFRRNAASSALAPLSPLAARTPPAAGPRHMAFSKDGSMAYSINELDLTVTVWRRDVQTGALAPAQTSLLLPERPVESSWTAAAILMHPSGRWLYGTVRGSDTLSIFRILDSGLLAKAAVSPLGVKAPRGAALDSSGRWLIAAGQDSGTIASCRIDQATGLPSPSGFTIKADRPTWIEPLRP